MGTEKKVTRQVVLDVDLDAKLNQDAQNETRKLSQHIKHIIKIHIEKVELEKQFISKKQYQS